MKTVCFCGCGVPTDHPTGVVPGHSLVERDSAPRPVATVSRQALSCFYGPTKRRVGDEPGMSTRRYNGD